MHRFTNLEDKPDDVQVGNNNRNSQKLPRVCNVLWKTWDKFWERTNISGMCNARSSNSVFRANVWMVIFAVFTCLTFYGLSNVIEDFYRYPVVTSVTVEHKNKVCNYIVIIMLYLMAKLQSDST